MLLHIQTTRYQAARKAGWFLGLLAAFGILPVSKNCVSQSPVTAEVAGQEEGLEIRPADVDARAQQLVTDLRAGNSLPAMWAMRYDLPSSKRFPGRTLQACSGIRKEGLDTLVSIDDQLHLGSCTKAMTACMIAQEISAGHLHWDTRLSDALPGNEQIQESPWANTTIAEMMRHRSGFPANAPWQQIHNQIPDDPIRSRAAVAEWLAEQPVPKTIEYLYSNVNYAILGHVLEVRVNTPWEELIRERLFEPLGIQRAGFGPVLGDEIDSQPWGHRVDASAGNLLSSGLAALVLGGKPKLSLKPTRIDNPVPLAPAGRVHMPITEWVKFVQLLACKTAPTQLDGLKQEDWEQLYSAGSEGNYGGGWILAERGWAGGKALTHAGTNTSWYCVAWVSPENGFVVLAATNCYDDSAAEACDKAIAGLIVIDQAE